MSNLATVKVFTDLIVWQKSHEFVLGVYKSKENFPKAEIYGLTSQFRRAAVSIAANIAEGFSKRGKVDKARYLQYCSRFYREMSLLPYSCPRLGFGENTHLSAKLVEVSKS